MDDDNLREFGRLYGLLRAEMDSLPGILDDPEQGREAWARVLAYIDEIEELFPPSIEPLPHREL